MKRLDQVVLVASFVIFSWLAMQAVHELGHVLGAVATGGRVVRVVLHPLAISRTDVHPNPWPLLQVWAGPLLGTTLPLAAYLLSRILRLAGDYLFRFFAGFCLVANGAYIAAGAVTGAGDAGELLEHGAPCWQLVLFGLATVPGGLYLWHGLGPKFGLGDARGNVSRSAAIASLVLLVLLVAIELAVAAIVA